jgi:hypothetical protein
VSSAGITLQFPFALHSLHVPQSVPAGLNVSVGQFTLEPSHFSSLSQSPALTLHTKVSGFFASAGQLAELPEHVSTMSQSPGAALHV